jgi:hypothetical protein
MRGFYPKYNSIRNDYGPHVSIRIEYVKRKLDNKWVRWELVDTRHEYQERDFPFTSRTNTRYMWIATGVWNKNNILDK